MHSWGVRVRLIAVSAVVVGVALALWSVRSKVVPSGLDGPLTTVEQVRNLPAHPSATIPVRLRGTLICVDDVFHKAFLQDSTGGIRIERATLDAQLSLGSVVEIMGTAAAGGATPVVMRDQVRVISRNSRLPEAIHASSDELFSGQLQYRWVEAEGVVRLAEMDHGGRVALTIRSGKHDVRFSVVHSSGISYGGLEIGRAHV